MSNTASGAEVNLPVGPSAPSAKVTISRDRVTIDRSRSTIGDLFVRLSDGRVRITDALTRLGARPQISDIDIPAVLGMCFERRSVPADTHLRGIHRVPCMSVADVRTGAFRLRPASSWMSGVEARKARRPEVERILRDELLAAAPERPAVCGAGTAARSIINVLGENDRPFIAVMADNFRGETIAQDSVTGAMTATSLPELAQLPWAGYWPPLAGPHIPTLRGLTAAAESKVHDVIIGHCLRELLGVGPGEALQSLGRLERLWVEPLDSPRGKRSWRHDHDDDHDPSARGIPAGWLTGSGDYEVKGRDLAFHSEWQRWTADLTRRTSRLLWALTDPWLASCFDLADDLGLRLRVPAAVQPLFGKLLAIDPRARRRVEAGRLIDAPVLEKIGADAPHRVPGRRRCRSAAVIWVPNAISRIQRFAYEGYLTRTGWVDGPAVLRSCSNPFGRAEQALELRRLVELDEWLDQLPGAS